MQIDKIISLANKKSELRFIAMVRSLRATGCFLPVWVIPYDDNKFDLPENCFWWEITEITEWIIKNSLWPAFRKIQCLTVRNYQFIDSDVIFLKNPEKVLWEHNGFVTSCTHWNNPDHTYTKETLHYLKQKTTTWQRLIFNSGQWACNQTLYTVNELLSFCENNFVNTLLNNNYDYKDQAGINILVNCSNILISNITLPPHNVESSWAGDYSSNYQKYWMDINKMPYLIHWAGCNMNTDRPINELFLSYLKKDEIIKWQTELALEEEKQNKIYNKIRKNITILKLVFKSMSFK